MSAPDTNTLRIAQVVPNTDAEGPGRRFAIWFQGCPLRCPGCCNPEFLSFHGGEARTIAELTDEIARQHKAGNLEGITLLGGEPFAHAEGGSHLAQFAQHRGLSVMIFTGHTLEELRARPEPAVHDLLHHTDILVDGPYLREQPDTERRWIGSRNQRIHFLSKRYDEADPRWRKRNTLEIRVENGTIAINGFPSARASALWKGWRRKTLNHRPQPTAPEPETR